MSAGSGTAAGRARADPADQLGESNGFGRNQPPQAKALQPVGDRVAAAGMSTRVG